MERWLVVRCPSLAEEDERGRVVRKMVAVVQLLEELCPAVEVIRPGVGALRTRGPARYFGGDRRLAGSIVNRLTDELGIVDAGVGVADGLFAAMAAADTVCGSSGDAGPPPVQVVPVGGTATFLAPLPVTVLERPKLADLLCRLGIGTLGRFAAVPREHVLARFGSEVVRCHEVAAGTAGEHPGLRLPSGVTAELAGRHRRPAPRQDGFWGGGRARTSRALAAAAAVTDLLGPESVLAGELRGGRGPAAQARLLPWRAPEETGSEPGPPRRVGVGGGAPGVGMAPGSAPWPGRIPPPAPVLVLHRPLRAELVDDGDRPIEVTLGGAPSAAPDRLSVAGKRWAQVISWSGPWPTDEGWWRTSRRLRARMQVATTAGAYLLWRDRDGWWVEGIYD